MTGGPDRLTSRAFTLTELLVVIGIIALALSLALPTLIPAITSGGETQARSVFAGLLSAARGLAVELNTYALVHVQMGTRWVQGNPVMDGKCWAGVMVYDDREKIEDPGDPNKLIPNPTYGKFVPALGYPPRALPGGTALGEVSGATVQASNMKFQQIANDATGEPDPDFTTFNLIIGPDGSLVDRVPVLDLPTGNINIGPPVLDTNSAPFAGAEDRRIWSATNVNLNENGVRMVVAFPYRDLRPLTPANRAAYLDKYGQVLCVNAYTGQLME